MLDRLYPPRSNRSHTKNSESRRHLSLEALEDRTTPSTLAVGADAGGSPLVEVYDADGTFLYNFLAYDARFTGGVHVAMGDVNGDGVQDIITGAGAGGGPHVRIFNGNDLSIIDEFFGYDSAFTGGVNVASGDVNGDGFDDVITGAGTGGGPHVKVHGGNGAGVLTQFFAYDAAFTGGVNVAVGDVNGDGFGDVITGAGAGGGPHVRAFSGTNQATFVDFFAYNVAFTGGVFVASGDLNNNGFADIVTGAGAGGGPHVRAFDGGGAGTLADFFAFDAAFTGGTRVASLNLDGLGNNAIVVGTGPGSAPTVRSFLIDPVGQVGEFSALDGVFSGGVFVGSTVVGNQAPSFTGGADETVLEDAGPQSVANWAINIQPGASDEAGQNLAFLVSTDNDALFAQVPTIDATTGELTYTPADDANGSATVTVVLVDDGGTANGGDDTSDAQTFTITVTPVNDAPSFTGSNQTASAGIGIVQGKNNGALGFGYANTFLAGQSFTATDDIVNLHSISYSYAQVNNHLAAPTIVMGIYEGVGFSGTLLGQSTATPSESDPSGTWITFEFAGVTLTSGEVYSFSLGTEATGYISGGFEATGVQENPYAGGTRLFPDGSTVGGDLRFQIAGNDASVSVMPWATDISAGPADEVGQSLTFNVTDNTNPGLFTVQPEIDADGNLTYTPAVGVSGTATITVTLTDDGSTTDGGTDTLTETFTITVS